MNNISTAPLATLICAAAMALCTPASAERILQGSLHGAPYTIHIPNGWNGTLVMFEDGYRDVADAPGEVEDRVAYPAYPGTDDLLLSHGYAIAGSAFRVNGYNIEEGIEDTRELMRFIEREVARPRRSVILGLSGGSTRAAKILESGDNPFDGAIATCGVMAGTPLFFDRAVDFATAYDAAFGWPAPWGTPGNVRDDLDFEIDVLPVFLPQVFNPGNFGRFEFMRLVGGLPIESFYDGDTYLFVNMFFTTEARAQMERKFGAPGAQNRDHHYSLAAADKAYLASLGVDANALLATMNAHTHYRADREVRKEVAKFGALEGKLHKPLLSMHATRDGLATVDNETVYRDLVRDSGRDDRLLQVYTDGIGHCTFTPDQVFATVRAMDSWLDTGHKPGASFFPASQGFVAGFVPGPWPQPTDDDHDHDHDHDHNHGHD